MSEPRKMPDHEEELGALCGIIRILRDLPAESQQWIVETAFRFFGMKKGASQ